MAAAPTVSQRARQRATESRLRAVRVPSKHAGGQHWYKVYNLTKHVMYKVYRVGINPNGTDAWRCSCPTQGQRCKHVQRVLDREEALTKQQQKDGVKDNLYAATDAYGSLYEEGPDDEYV